MWSVRSTASSSVPRAMSSRLSFGLNFERHRPEAVELPQRLVRRGDKVRVLPPRGSTTKGDQRLCRVKAIHKTKTTAVLDVTAAAVCLTRRAIGRHPVLFMVEFGAWRRAGGITPARPRRAP